MPACPPAVAVALPPPDPIRLAVSSATTGDRCEAPREAARARAGCEERLSARCVVRLSARASAPPSAPSRPSPRGAASHGRSASPRVCFPPPTQGSSRAGGRSASGELRATRRRDLCGYDFALPTEHGNNGCSGGVARGKQR